MKQLESPQSGQPAGANASAAKSRAVFKQYGERRTGTNYLRFLMEQNFSRQYDLHPRGGAVLWSKKITRPADSDHLPAHAGKATFDPEYYLQARYMNSMTPWMRTTISLNIDWQLMSKFGYERQ